MFGNTGTGCVLLQIFRLGECKKPFLFVLDDYRCDIVYSGRLHTGDFPNRVLFYGVASIFDPQYVDGDEKRMAEEALHNRCDRSFHSTFCLVFKDCL